MSDLIHLKVGGRIVVLHDLSTIKKGYVFRISCGTFWGPWRKAAADASHNAKGQWVVRPEGSKKNNGYDG
jgi:hypothetical protein